MTMLVLGFCRQEVKENGRRTVESVLLMGYITSAGSLTTCYIVTIGGQTYKVLLINVAFERTQAVGLVHIP